MSSVDQSSLDHTDRGTGLVGPAVVLSSVATIVNVARFWARKLTRQSFGLDEWLCLAALLAQHVFLAACAVSVFCGGMGRDLRIAAAKNPQSLVVLQKSIIVTNVAWVLSSLLIKLSVLAFYWRLFPTRTVRLGCKLLTILCIAWLIAVIVLNSIGCWHNVIGPKNHCLAGDGHLLSTDALVIPATANCVIDFLTLALPIQEIYKLKISTKKKIKIGGVFLLGGIACAANVLFSLHHALLNSTSDKKRMLITEAEQFVLAGFAALVEVYVAIIGACLPIMGPVYQRLRDGGKRGKGSPAPGVSQSDGEVGQSTHTPNKKNQTVAGHLTEALDDTLDDDSLTLGAYPGNRRVYTRGDGRNNTLEV